MPSCAEPSVSTFDAEGLCSSPPPPEVHRSSFGHQDAFFSGCGRGCADRFTVLEVVGRGSYGTVCAAIDNLTGERVAIKRIAKVFEHPKDATRILREIKLLGLLKHPDIVGIKHILLPSDARRFNDLFVVFELMESDLHTVIGANDDLTADHHKVFLYQLLRGLAFIHGSGVLHRDLKPKNLLANANCKLKICDFGLARPFLGEETATAWTDYVATRWYRAPELCGCFYGIYSQAVDIWSAGCIFAETLLGKPLFPGRDTVHQLQLITDLLGKPPASFIDRISNQKARAFLHCLPPKAPRPFEENFSNVDHLALDLLRQLLSFNPADRPSAAEALQHPYFHGLPRVAAAGCDGVSSQFDFDSRALTTREVRDLIYMEVLNYHPHAKARYAAGSCRAFASQFDSNDVDGLKRQFMEAEMIGSMPSSRLSSAKRAALEEQAAAAHCSAGRQQHAAAATTAQELQQQQQQGAGVAMQCSKQDGMVTTDVESDGYRIAAACGGGGGYTPPQGAGGGSWPALYGHATCAMTAAAKFAPAAMPPWRNEYDPLPDEMVVDW